MVSMICNSSSLRKYFYLDYQKKVCIDNNTFFEKIVRTAALIFHFRNYNLSSVLTVLESDNKDVEAIEFIKRKIAKKSGLSEFEYESLLLLSEHYASYDNVYSKIFFKKLDAVSLKFFLESSIGNKKLNRNIKNFNQMLTPFDQKIHKKAIDSILMFSYKTNNLAHFENAYEKVCKIGSILQSDGSLKSQLAVDEKLTHKDLIEIEEKVKLMGFLKELEKMSLIKSDDKLERLLEKVKKCSSFVNQVQTVLETQAPHKKGGVLIFYDVNNYRARRTKIEAFFDNVIFQKIFRTNVFHASMGYQDERKQDIEVDIWGRFRKNRRSLYSRTFKSMEINVERVAKDEENRKKLIKLYGSGWVGVLEKKYHKIIQDYFKDPKKFDHLYNPGSRRLLVGLGFRWTPFNPDIKKRIQFNKENKCVCSEFTLKVFMQCFEKLSAEIESDWDKKFKNSEKDRPRLDHPVRAYRSLHRVKPNEIINRLLETGFGKVLPQASIIDQIVDYYHYDLKVNG